MVEKVPLPFASNSPSIGISDLSQKFKIQVGFRKTWFDDLRWRSSLKFENPVSRNPVVAT